MAAARRLLASPARPDTIYTTEAPAGSHLVTAVHEQNLVTPDDVLVAYLASVELDVPGFRVGSPPPTQTVEPAAVA